MECNSKIEMHQKDQRKLEYEDFADDDFYTEIRHQILLLTAEDDEEQVMQSKMKKRSNGSKGTFITHQSNEWANHRLGWWESNHHREATSAAPVWLVNLWRSHGSGSGGTGVFIPHIVKSRRKYKPVKGRQSTLVM